MNIAILSGSPRKGGSTDRLVEAFAKGVDKSRHSVKIFSVNEHRVGPCLGCNVCKGAESRCVQQDDMEECYQMLSEAEMLVIASPVYFFGISAQLKAVIDRLHNPVRNNFHIGKLMLIGVGASSRENLFNTMNAQMDQALAYFDLEDAGRLLVQKVREPEDLAGTGALEKAEEMGRKI